MNKLTFEFTIKRRSTTRTGSSAIRFSWLSRIVFASVIIGIYMPLYADMEEEMMMMMIRDG